MKKNFTLAVLSITSFAFSQNSMTLLNQKKIPATPEWQFVCENYSYEGFLRMQIGKLEKGGIIKLSIKTSTIDLYIGDRIFVLLKNNDFVYCLDKGVRFYENGTATTFYNLNELEFKKLTVQNITDVRFKILGKQKAFDSQIGFFTASNLPTVFDAYSKEVKSIDTKSDLKKIIK